MGMAALSGAASGALAATGVGLVGSIVGNAAISMASNAATQVIENKGFSNFDAGSMFVDGAIGAAAGAIGGKEFGSKHLNTLGKQATKRTVNALTNKGIQVAISEAKKAASYYIKNSATLITSGIRSGIIKPSIFSTGMSTVNYYYKRYAR